ncbi:hypothetical protein J2W55_004265 [Mucilaginibacter pocheonensis]|uniref:Uncharacterized protein n=1 Tax=Mucilaginibacter pocheonensis TaxID=398050 RepID=A0ABU1TGR9_9SPHI|nr:hypothetical protein [Mucilaginibacter pocheonensis]
MFLFIKIYCLVYLDFTVEAFPLLYYICIKQNEKHPQKNIH